MLLIATPNLKDDVVALIETAKALGFDIFVSPPGWRLPQHILGQHGIVYGEALFCEVIAQQMGWQLLDNSLDWLTKLPEKYVSRKIYYTTMVNARKESKKRFFKPADMKSFEAKVYESGKDLSDSSVLDEIPVLVSEEMNFTSEYRCFIKNRKVVSASCYLYKKDINKPEHYFVNNDAVISFVNNMLKDDLVGCVPGAVIDVGRFKKDTYAVIESNPAYASGLYGCELVAVLDVLKSCVVN
jgi:hypothetical protein